MDHDEPSDAAAGDVFAALDLDAAAAGEDALDLGAMELGPAETAAWDLDLARHDGEALEDAAAWDLWADVGDGEDAADVLDDAEVDVEALAAQLETPQPSSTAPATTTTRTTTARTTPGSPEAAAAGRDAEREQQSGSRPKRPTKAAENRPPLKDDRNAEACRRSRLKRKADIENLRRRNAELEARRELFLERIAQLQLEVSALRHDSCVDLDKENQLLRAEVCKHRAFINNIMRAVDEAPAMVLEERVRLLTSGIQSSVGQVVGLLHTSTTWRAVEPIETGCGLLLKYFYQLLPIGATLETAKRVNMRAEIHNIDVPADAFAEDCWRLGRDLDLHYKMENERAHRAGAYCDVRRFTTPELEEAAGMLEDAFDLIQITDMKRNTCEASSGGEDVESAHSQTCAKGELLPDAAGILLRSWVASTMARRKLFPRAFVCAGPTTSASQEVLSSLSQDATECHVLAMTELSKDLERAKIISESSDAEQTRRPSSSMLTGLAIVPTVDGSTCHVTSIWSMPVGVFTGMLTDTHDLFNDDGSLTEAARDDLAAKFSVYVQSCITKTKARLRACASSSSD